MSVRVLTALLFLFLVSPAFAQEADQPVVPPEADSEQQPADAVAADNPQNEPPSVVAPEPPVVAPEMKRVPPATPAAKNFDPPPYTPPKPMRFNPDNRFSKPADPVVMFRDAENVVLLDLGVSDLPEFIQGEIQGMLASCPAGKKGTSGIKVYSYVSDLIRSRGLSPNYVVDFSGFASNAQSSCASNSLCNEDGCLLVTYNSFGYNQWKRDAQIRNKGWSSSLVSTLR